MPACISQPFYWDLLVSAYKQMSNRGLPIGFIDSKKQIQHEKLVCSNLNNWTLLNNTLTSIQISNILKITNAHSIDTPPLILLMSKTNTTCKQSKYKCSQYPDKYQWKLSGISINGIFHLLNTDRYAQWKNILLNFTNNNFNWTIDRGKD